MGAPNSGGRRTAALAASVLLFAEHRFRSYCGAFTLVPTGRPWALQNASLGARAITASLLVDNGRRRVLRPTELTHKALSLTSAAANLVESRDYGVTATGSKTVHVARGKARLFWDGNPLVYGGAVSAVRGDPVAGDIVDVVDSSGKFIAWGVYNPDSMYRVRVLAREGEPLANCRDIRAVLRERLKTARDVRRAIGIPSSDTDIYRHGLVNSEGDRLSGLVIDIFAGVIGVSSSAVWVELFRPEVEAALRDEFGAEAQDIVWRRSDGRLQQDGWNRHDTAVTTAGGASERGRRQGMSAAGAKDDGRVEDLELPAEEVREADDDVQVEKTETFGGKESMWDAVPPTVVRELGLEYETFPRFGQKTGFYCDQRENREAIRKLSAGKRVLDMFCYSGGFALNSAAGGAVRVIAVDSSQPAVEAARKNAVRNGLEGPVQFVKGDALEFMKATAAVGEKFDLVILDPPKLAPNKKALPRATSRYRRLNAAALELITPGGILVTFTCSAAMTQSGEFVGVVQSAAAAVGRKLRLLRTVGPSADHVTDPCYPESAYLTGAFFCVI